nr:RNA-directed DNA polymerase, eukaryota [Tanacetum cinerariifolium]
MDFDSNDGDNEDHREVNHHGDDDPYENVGDIKDPSYVDNDHHHRADDHEADDDHQHGNKEHGDNWDLDVFSSEESHVGINSNESRDFNMEKNFGYNFSALHAKVQIKEESKLVAVHGVNDIRTNKPTADNVDRDYKYNSSRTRKCSEENIHHVLFGCDLAENIFRRICRWWELDWQALESFSDWNYWFFLIRLSSKVKALLEGVYCVAWWSIWGFRNRTIYNEMPPGRSVLFDDIVSLSFNWFSSRYKVLVRKLLNSAQKKFLPIVATIEQYQDLDEMSFEEAIGRLTIYEERIKSQDILEVNDQDKLLMASSNNKSYGKWRGKDFNKEAKESMKWKNNPNARRASTSQGTKEKSKLRCYECGEHGHFAKESTKVSSKNTNNTRKKRFAFLRLIDHLNGVRGYVTQPKKNRHNCKNITYPVQADVPSCGSENIFDPLSKIKRCNNRIKSNVDHDIRCYQWSPYCLSMDILSLNIRGVGEDHKRSWLKRLCFDHKSLMGSQGGILVVWDTSWFTMSDSKKGDGYLADLRNWHDIDSLCLMVIVYSPQGLHDKEMIQNDLT